MWHEEIQEYCVPGWLTADRLSRGIISVRVYQISPSHLQAKLPEIGLTIQSACGIAALRYGDIAVWRHGGI